MPVRLPSYIYRNRCGVFYVRVIAPLALAFERREFRFSLRTTDRVEALLFSRYFGHRLADLFANLCAMAKQKKASNGQPEGITSEQFLAWIQVVKAKYTALQRIEELEELRTTEHAEHQRELAAQTTKAQAVVERAYTRGILKGIAAGAPALAPESPLLSDVIEDFARFKAAKGKWTEKTKEENFSALNLFRRIVGDRPVAPMTQDTMMPYVEILKKLPPNMTKKFPGMSIEDVLATNPAPISARTFNKNVERVSSLFKWAKNNPRYGLTHNPAAGLSIDESGGDKRMPFTMADLTALFGSQEFTRREFQNTYAYWLMPLALFTGARLGELTQLYVSDVVDLEGIPCLNISDEEEGQRLKTGNAKRLVPMHSALTELGFLRYAAKLRAEGVERIFPELTLRRDGFGHAASNWFQRYKKRCGIHEKQTKVFHSFRHLFISRLLGRRLARARDREDRRPRGGADHGKGLLECERCPKAQWHRGEIQIAREHHSVDPKI